MDTNVPPESTMRLADALIKADKDFELLVVPNANHGMGGAYGQRRMRDFFVRHLLGTETPGQHVRPTSDLAAIPTTVPLVAGRGSEPSEITSKHGAIDMGDLAADGSELAA